MTPNRSFSCVVHSVFERVCNLKLCDGTIITLGREDVSNGPGIILCRTENGFRFNDHLNTNTPGASRSSILRLGQELQIDLRSATAWRPRINKANASSLPNQLNACTEHLHRNSKFNWVEKFIGSPDQVLDIEKCLFTKLRPLVGKGPGLTPLGDDYIVGLAAGIETHPNSRALISKWLTSVHKNTTDLSGRALHYASRGWFIEPIVEFVNNISIPTMAVSLNRLLSIGHTSGTAMAYGCLVGLKVRQSINLRTCSIAAAHSINQCASGNVSDRRMG